MDISAPTEGGVRGAATGRPQPDARPTRNRAAHLREDLRQALLTGQPTASIRTGLASAERELEIAERIQADAEERRATKLKADFEAALDVAEATWRAELTNFVGGLLPGDWAPFTDASGKRRKRKLVGVRGKRKIRYHFAVSARPQIWPIPRLVIYSHVVFSEGGTLVTAKIAAQRYRKALCKGWWNAEWRDRQIAMMTYLAQEAASFDLPLGGVVATVEATPLRFEAPLTYVRHDAEVSPEIEDEPDDFDETLDDLNAHGGAEDEEGDE